MIMNLQVRIYESTPGDGKWKWSLLGNDGQVRLKGDGCVLLDDDTEVYSPEAALASAYDYMCKILARQKNSE